MCTHNAARSQLAEALLVARSAGRVVARSAGIDPAVEVDPQALTVLAEIGIDAAGPYANDKSIGAADVVVTIGCGDACPVVPGRRYADWNLPDPVGGDLAEVRAVRDRIDTRVQAFLTELEVT